MKAGGFPYFGSNNFEKLFKVVRGHFEKKHNTPMVPAAKQRFLTEKQIRMCKTRFKDEDYMFKSFARAGKKMDQYSPFDIDSPIEAGEEYNVLTR